MIHIDASQLDHRRLNEQIRHSPGTLRITGCLGQRFIGAGAERGRLEITGTPGNALGAYLDGACIEVRGNAPLPASLCPAASPSRPVRC